MTPELPPVPESPAKSPARTAAVVVAALAVAAGAWWLAPRPPAWRTPTQLGKAGAYPEEIRRDGGAWFWIERPRKESGARLVRATAGALQPVAAGDAIGSYALGEGDTVFWTVREGKRWSVVQAGRDGKSPRTLWSGDDEPRGLAAAGQTLYWIRRTPPRLPDPGPFAALDGTLEVVALAAGASAPTRVAALPESEEGFVLGRWGEGLAVVCRRTDNPGSTGLYRVPLDGRPPTRFFSAVRKTRPILTRDGTLYGLAPSEETAPPLDGMVLLEFAPDGSPRPVSDWLPVDGIPCDTGRGILYADQEIPPRLWRVRGADALPEPLELPEGFVGVAAGDGALLLATNDAVREKPTLYEVPQR